MTIKYKHNLELSLDSCSLNYSISGINKFICNHFMKGDKFAVCLLDINNFKFYNYKYGYKFGDTILAIVFYKAKSVIRDMGNVYIVGGGRLLIILEDIISKENIENIIGSIFRIFNYPINLWKMQIEISINIGVAMYPNDGTTIEDVLKYTEIALNYSKRCCDNKYRFFEQKMYSEIIELSNVEDEIKEAIHNNEFTIYYQPQIDINKMKVFGLEALLRWEHPEKGILPTSHFIGILEQNEMINEIGKFVFLQACKQLMEWQKMGFYDLSMSINVSKAQLTDASFLDFIEDVLEKTKVQGEHINIEITERILVNPSKHILNTLSVLRSKGIKILIDDFGVKYSTLNYLYCFPIDGIKIDKSFIDRIGFSEKEFIITKNIVNLAHELNIDVIAEGVEQKEQLEILKKISCEKIQGFIFEKPVAPGEVTDFLIKFK